MYPLKRNIGVRISLSLVFWGLVNVILCWSNPVNYKLYINSGSFTTVNKQTFPYWAFNETPTFNPASTVLEVKPGDTLLIRLINNDEKPHSLGIKTIDLTSRTLLPGDSLQETLVFKNEGVYIFYDHYNLDNKYLGLSGMICVSESGKKKYFWNLKEHSAKIQSAASKGNTINWKTYYPDYFTINGRSYPEIQNDPTARIVAQRGDTIRIFISNSGYSKHPIHFHGFHPRVVFSSSSNMMVNSYKDSFPLQGMESMILELIPDKTGQYSVHDHNLVAVTGGGIHPNGMFLIMRIDE